MSEDKLVQTMSIETDDFEELQESAEGWDQHYTQMSPGAFNGVLDMRMVGSRQVFREYFGRKLRYEGAGPIDGFGFALPLDQTSSANWIGERIGSNTSIVQVPGQEGHFVGSEPWDALLLAVSEDEVRSISSALADDDVISRSYPAAVSLRPEIATRLRFEGRQYLKESAVITPENQEQMARQSEQFVKLYIWSIVDARSEEGHVYKTRRTTALVRKATDLAMSSPQETVGLVEICEFLDVSLRTLNYAFKDVTGMSPATWLRVIRLNRIHKILKSADPDELLVKQVALDNGFFHLGHFSKQYKRHFHCLPSETLRGA